MVITLACVIIVPSCKDDKSTETPGPTTSETPLIQEGQLVNSVFYVDNVVKEEMIDTVVNFGSEEIPALFYVNKSHTIDNIPVTEGNTYTNAFRSLSRADIYQFIMKWGQLFGMDININDTSANAVALRRQAFFMLVSYLRETDMDFPLLLAISGGDLEQLQYAKKWVDVAHDIAQSGYSLDPGNTPNYIFRSLEKTGHTPKELSLADQFPRHVGKRFPCHGEREWREYSRPSETRRIA